MLQPRPPLRFFTLLLGSLLFSLVSCASSVRPPAAAPTPTPADEQVSLYESPPDEITSVPEPTLLPTPDADMPTAAPTLLPTPKSCPDNGSVPRTVLPAQRVVLPILMYHHVRLLSATARPIWRGLTVRPDAFEQQAAYLAAHHYHTISFSDLIAYFKNQQPLPDKPIILTFDDAWRDDYTAVYPVLVRNCLIGTFFPPIKWVGTSASTLTWPQLKEMSAAGMEIGSHTLNHHLVAFETEAQIREQLLNSKLILEENLHKPVVVLAYPGGSFNTRVVQLVSEEGYGAAVSTRGGVLQSSSEIYSLRRVAIRYSDDISAFVAKITAGR